MTPQATVLALLARRGFEEQSVPGFYLLDNDATKVAVDLNHQIAFPGVPVVGVLQVNGDILEEGHGISRIDDLRREIIGILKSNSKKSQSSSTEHAHRSDLQESNLQLSARIGNVEKSKLGTPDTLQSSDVEHKGTGSNLKSHIPDTSKEVKDETRQTTERQDDKNILIRGPGKDQKIEVTGGVRIPPKLTDAERDAIIEKAKAERFLTQRGSSYKVQGKERPDSHMIQSIANDKGISLEILSAQQTNEFAVVIVRAHLNGVYCDAVVHHEFKDEFLLRTMEAVNKYPDILDHWEGTEPVLKEGAKIETWEDGKKTLRDAKYFIVHSLLTWKKFALRDARTKAGAIAESMLLNQDFREPEEKQSEEAEAAMIQRRGGK